MAAVKAANAQLSATLPWHFLDRHFAVGSVHFVTIPATFCQAQLWTLNNMLSLTAFWNCRDPLLGFIRKQIGYNSCNNSSSSNNNSSSSNSSALLTVRHCS